MGKTGYLSITPSVRSSATNAKNRDLWRVLFQEHNAFVLLKNKKNQQNMFFGVALFQKRTDCIKIKVHHKNIAIYDVYDTNSEWMLYVAPYCVKHGIIALFQKCIDKQQ